MPSSLKPTPIAFPHVDGETTGPATANVTNGNGNTKQALIGNGARYLSLARSTGLSGQAVTIVVIFQPSTETPTSITLADLSTKCGNFSKNRLWLGAISSTGYPFRKPDGIGTSSIASADLLTSGTHLSIGRAPAGAAMAALFNLDGGSNVSAPQLRRADWPK